MGRPTKLTPETYEEILGLLQKGVSRRHIAAQLGLNKSTISEWCTRGAGEESGIYRELYDAVESVAPRYKADGTRSATRKSDPALLMLWWLARRFPAEYGTRRPTKPIPYASREEMEAHQAQLREHLVERAEALFGPDPAGAPALRSPDDHADRS